LNATFTVPLFVVEHVADRALGVFVNEKFTLDTPAADAVTL
jgi:hypothetical protein